MSDHKQLVSALTSMTARTEEYGYQPSRATLAARSLHNVDRIKDVDERREAFRRHLEEFPPLWSMA